MAFLQGKGWSGGQVKVVDSRTGAAIPVPGTLFATGRPAFTPDGRHLVGNLRRERQLEAFRSLDLETGELKTLLRLPSPRQPWALSSDGKWVAYVTTMDMPEQQTGNDGPQADLWKVPSSGGEAERIVRFPARIHDLCWSPAGDALYVSTELGGVHNDLYRVALDDPERPTRVTFGQADEDWPSVSRDGRRLLYAIRRGRCPSSAWISACLSGG